MSVLVNILATCAIVVIIMNNSNISQRNSKNYAEVEKLEVSLMLGYVYVPQIISHTWLK